QVAEVVHEPEAAPPLLLGRRPLAPGQGVGQPAVIDDLACDAPVLVPDAQDTMPPAVAQAVGEQLADDDDQLFPAERAQTLAIGIGVGETTSLVEKAAIEDELLRPGGRCREGPVERRGGVVA